MANTYDLLSDQVSFDQQPRHVRNRRGNGPAQGPDASEDLDDSETARRAANQDTFLKLSRYYQTHSHDADWLNAPELPTSAEVAWIDETGNHVELDMVYEENQLVDPYESMEHYLRTQYRLMREDAVSTLRDAVDDMMRSPNQTEQQSLKNVRIYNRVYITGLTVAAEGVAHTLEFHTDRVDKKISWAQSKRLKGGTLVALSPAEPRGEIFRNRCLVGIVAARPLAELESSQPSINVYFGHDAMMDIDTQVEYLMIEASGGYFEAVRHTLKALQHMRDEKFPLSEYLVKGETAIGAPASLLEDPYVDIAPALQGHVKRSVDILEGWPTVRHVDTTRTDTPSTTALPESPPATTLDPSQFEALRRMLTKKLAIVQGPPGTGKTHVSVIALRTILQNRKHGDPPIIVTAQTNHALDQLLRHIAPFAPDFIRLGGQTQDQEVIAPRTIYKVKDENNRSAHRDLRHGRTTAWTNLETISKRIRELLAPLTSEDPIHPDEFYKAGLISEKQCELLIEAKATWAGVTDKIAETPIGIWSEGEVTPFQKAPPERDTEEIDVEDDDEDLYQMKDVDLEVGVVEDEKDTLFGFRIPLSPGFAGNRNESARKLEALVKKCDNLHQIPVSRRGAVYNFLQNKLKEKLLPKFRELVRQAKAAALQLKIARARLDAAFLREAPVLGMTTTGLSKYRGLISSLEPKIVLIEEAAETQESYVTATCFETLEQLILVGDHLQLRAHCQNPVMEEWYLNISLFERLVRYHGIEFQQLTTQRRMLPEFREIMNVIYPELKDHPCVHGREDIPGMNGNNSWFWSHQTTESADEQFSWVNAEEAEFVAAFCKYLIHNGTPAKDITILTFYKGQQRKLRECLRKLQHTNTGRIQISTVDAYQGEENEIILLSLVRNNERNRIGFLNIDNRVCVAMSRARRGFYLFGNSQLLAENNKTWRHMLKIMRKREQCAVYLPIVCKRHGNETRLYGAAGWLNNDGGCNTACRTPLECGHTCMLFCHPEDHDQLPCTHDCSRTLPCGHACSEQCGSACSCKTCAENAKDFRRRALEHAQQEAVLSNEFNGDVSVPVLAVPGHPENDSIDGEDEAKPWEVPSRRLNGGLVDFVPDGSAEDVGTSYFPSLTKAAPTGALNDEPETWTGREKLNGWNEYHQYPLTSDTGAARPHQDRRAGIQAYQAFAQGGVQDDDRQLADAVAREAVADAEQRETFGLNSPDFPTFGGAMPVRLAAREVEHLSSVKAYSNQSPTSRSAASRSASTTSRPGLDPFQEESSDRFAINTNVNTQRRRDVRSGGSLIDISSEDAPKEGSRDGLPGRKRFTHIWAPITKDIRQPISKNDKNIQGYTSEAEGAIEAQDHEAHQGTVRNATADKVSHSVGEEAKDSHQNFADLVDL